MQQRRGTASQWSAANPVLASGEIGFETDTNKFKMGNGTSTWSSLQYYANAAELAAIVDGAPELLNTLNELAAAIGDDADFFTNIGESIASSVDTHSSTQTNVHGIANTQLLATLTEIAATEDYADAAVATHAVISTNVHGVDDFADLAKTSDVNSAIGDAVGLHSADTTNIHGILDTADLATQTDVDDARDFASGELTDHNASSLNVHGIADTSLLATQDFVATAIGNSAVDQALLAGVGIDWNSSTDQYDIDSTVATKTYVGTAVSDHNAVTTSVHGIANTALLATTANVATAKSEAITAADTAADTKVSTAVAALTKSSVGLGNVDNTSDANKPVSTATQTALDAKLALAGGTLTGALTLSGAPTSDLHAATKLYVDGLAAGINFHQPVVAATAGNLAGDYNNGTNGFGATLTGSANGAIGTIDGAAVSVGSRILLKSQTDATQNGIYTVTNAGSGSTKWIITRAADADNNPAGELATGDFVFVTSGSTNGSKGYILSTTGTITIGTTNVNYSQFNASEAITAGTNITKSGSTVSVADAPTFSGAVTASSGVVFSDGTQTKEGVASRTPIVQKTASYTLSALTERDSLIEVSSATGVTVTIPANSAVAYPVGTSIDILQTSTGQVTIAGAAGVTVNATPGLKLRTTWSSATLFKRATDTWVVYGDLTA